jgi:hypothetical protein
VEREHQHPKRPVVADLAVASHLGERLEALAAGADDELPDTGDTIELGARALGANRS